MDYLKLKIITPKKKVFNEEVKSVTAPASDGEITILPRHTNLFSLLKEGIIKIIKKNEEEEYLAIGGGYLETDGEEVNLLVSRAYKQDEINEEEIKKAMEEAKKMVSQVKDETQRQQALSTLRKSIIDLKLIRKKKGKPFNP
jgi:F-type H+-transporting ATPase subunit epsilon